MSNKGKKTCSYCGKYFPKEELKINTRGHFCLTCYQELFIIPRELNKIRSRGCC